MLAVIGSGSTYNLETTAIRSAVQRWSNCLEHYTTWLLVQSVATLQAVEPGRADDLLSLTCCVLVASFSFPALLRCVLLDAFKQLHAM